MKTALTPKALLALAFCLVVSLTACDRSPLEDARRWIGLPKAEAPKRMSDPVERTDGMAYIPIDDTAFLIPEKTWLKGYSRNSTDGLVYSITLHATIPDVQPWSQARHDEMYWPAGPGKKLEIYIKGGGVTASDFFVSRSKRPPGQFIEETSDQATQGLRKFRRVWTFYKDKSAEDEAVRQFGRESVEELRRDAGKPMMDTSFYEFIEHERVKYFIYCSDSKGGFFQSCHLIFPWATSATVYVDVHFVRDHLRHIVSMADKLSARLHEFEAAGLAYQAAKAQSVPTPQSPPTRQ